MVAVDNVYVALDEACTLLPSLKNSYALTSAVVDAQVKITFAPSTGEALFDVSVGVAGLSGEVGQNHLLNINENFYIQVSYIYKTPLHITSIKD